MPQNCKMQDFFVKCNVYTSLESLVQVFQKVQVLEKYIYNISGCHGNGPNFLKKSFFKNYNIMSLER